MVPFSLTLVSTVSSGFWNTWMRILSPGPSWYSAWSCPSTGRERNASNATSSGRTRAMLFTSSRQAAEALVESRAVRRYGLHGRLLERLRRRFRLGGRVLGLAAELAHVLDVRFVAQALDLLADGLVQLPVKDELLNERRRACLVDRRRARRGDADHVQPFAVVEYPDLAVLHFLHFRQPGKRDLLRRAYAALGGGFDVLGLQPGRDLRQVLRLGGSLLDVSGDRLLLVHDDQLLDAEEAPLGEELGMLRIVFLHVLGARLCLGGGELLDVAPREDLAARRFDGLHCARRAVELLFQRLLPRQLLVDQPFEDLALCALGLVWTDLLATQGIVDLMDGDLIAVHLRRDLGGGRLLVALATAGGKRRRQQERAELKARKQL